MSGPFAITVADLHSEAHQRTIVSLLDAYARDIQDDGSGLNDDVRERLIPGLQSHPTTLVLLAFDDETPVGFAVCFYGFSTFAARRTINIHDIGVLRDYRGRGIARTLLETVAQHAADNDCCKLTLEVEQDNTRARRLYESVGFAVNRHLADTATVLYLEKPVG